MPTFKYTAVDGQGKIASGELAADSLEAALAQLVERGYTIKSISLDESNAPQQHQAGLEASPAETLESYLQTVLPSYLSIAPALRARAAELPANEHRRALESFIATLERQDASEAARGLREQPDYWMALLSSDSTPSALKNLLPKFLSLSQQSAELNRHRWVTFAYPGLILLLAVGVLTAMCWFIVPIFDELYRDFALDLPAATRLLITISRLVQSSLVLPVIVILALPAAFLWFGWRWLPVRLRQLLQESLERFMPIRTHRHTSVARFATFVAGLLEAGMPTPTAVRLAGEATGRTRMERAAMQLAEAWTSHGVPSQAQTPIAIPLAVQHALCGDISTQARVALLREYGTSHSEQAQRKLSWNYDLYGPIALIAVGLIVGWAVMALFLPLVSLVSNLS